MWVAMIVGLIGFLAVVAYQDTHRIPAIVDRKFCAASPDVCPLGWQDTDSEFFRTGKRAQ